MKKTENNRGFTLIEVIVVAAIIAILAGILVPMIFNQIDEAKISRAKGDAKAIQTAFLAFRKDVGRWPNLQSGATNYAFLYGPGYTAAGTHDAKLTTNGYTLTLASSLDDHLMNNVPGYPVTGETKWKGPYMAGLQTDPWGNPYVINANGLDDATKAVWVLSAGPNGIFETASIASFTTVLANDDIGVRIK